MNNESGRALSAVRVALDALEFSPLGEGDGDVDGVDVGAGAGAGPDVGGGTERNPEFAVLFGTTTEALPDGAKSCSSRSSGICPSRSIRAILLFLSPSLVLSLHGNPFEVGDGRMLDGAVGGDAPLADEIGPDAERG